MSEGSPEDDFDKILRQCRDRLSEITLELPDIDAAPPPRRMLLAEPPAEPAPPPEPPPRSEAPSPSVPAPAPAAPAAAPPAQDASGGGKTRTPRSLRGLAGAGALTVIVCGAFWMSRLGGRDLTWTLERADAMSGIPENGGVAVAAGNTVTLFDRDGRPSGTRQIETPVAAISWSKGAFWTANGSSPALVEHRAEGGTSSFALSHVPSAVDADSKYIWSIDAKGKQLHQLLITRSMLGMYLQPLDRFDLPQYAIESFNIDSDGVLWLVDSSSLRLHRLKTGGAAFRPIDSAPLAPIVDRADRVKGLFVDHGRLWILTVPADGRGGAVLKRRTLRRLNWTPS